MGNDQINCSATMIGVVGFQLNLEESRTIQQTVVSMNPEINRKLRMGLIGGGGAAFIGKVHAISATLDNRARLCAGVLSSDPQKSKESAPTFGIRDDRAYANIAELLAGESKLDEKERIDFVSIATPNHTHAEIAQAALKAGFHVICDKPMTNTVQDARELVKTVEETGRIFALTHNYTGYPMVRQAREIIEAGQKGDILAIRSSYMQGWLTTFDSTIASARGAWKSEPSKAGSGSLGDIGTHAYNLLRFVSGLNVNKISATTESFHPTRNLDDYGLIQLRMENGALGLITYSQMSHGRLNDLTLEIDGTKGSLQWSQEEPNRLIVRRQGASTEIMNRHPAGEYMHELARLSTRIPGGHPEGFYEAFANVYRAAFDDIAKNIADGFNPGINTLYPNVYDGLEGVRFIERVQSSSDAANAWLDF